MTGRVSQQHENGPAGECGAAIVLAPSLIL